MIKRTKYTFDLKMTDEMDSAEYAALVSVLDEMGFDGSIYGEAIKSDLYQITIERVYAT